MCIVLIWESVNVVTCFVLFCLFFSFFFWFVLQGEVEIDDDDLSTLEVRVFSKILCRRCFPYTNSNLFDSYMYLLPSPTQENAAR